MNLLDLDPLTWLHAGLTAGLNLLSLLAGLTFAAVAAIAFGALVITTGDSVRAGYRRRRTSRRAWREQG